MLCVLCKTAKLRKEFLTMDICKRKHIEKLCLRCITDFVEEKECCPVCEEPISSDNKSLIACQEKLKWLFPDFEDDENENEASCAKIDSFISSEILVVMLGGECAKLSFHSSMRVKDFKASVKSHFNVEIEMQKLLYKDQELETHHSFIPKTMKDYNVQAHGTIQLVKILKTLSPSVEHVIFEFSWGFPDPLCPDFLDASALLYSGSKFIDHVDYRHTFSWQANGAVSHSGHARRSGGRGNHRMNVRLTDLPLNIDKVFFTLSSWRSPSIANYKRPSLQFYDTRNPSKQLCSEEFGRAINRRAVIMCSVCRDRDGNWTVYSLGEPSSGNCMRENYYLLQGTIEDIIRKGIC